VTVCNVEVYSSDAVLENVDVSWNIAETAGGGIHLSNSSPEMTNIQIRENSLNQTGVCHSYSDSTGGGIYAYNSDPVITNAKIVGNYCADENQSHWGGGISMRDSNASITQSVIAMNTAPTYGGGLYLRNSTASITNTIITENYASIIGGIGSSDDALLSHSNNYGNTPNNYDQTDQTGTNGNLSVDPLFLAADDYHLDPASPCIDAGDPAILDPDGSPSDMGGYGGPDAEFWDLDMDGYYEWWLPGPYDPATSPGMDCDDGDDGVYPGTGC